MIKRIRRFLLRFSGPAFWTVIGLLFVGILLGFKLATLVPGASAAEVTAKAGTTTISALLDNPLYLPHRIVGFIMQQITGGGILAMRSVSALFGLLSVCLMYYVLKAWHTNRVAIFGTLLYASSSWFLHTARSATPDIMMTMLLALLVAGIWFREHKRRWVALFAVALMATFLVYIPGMVWFILAVTIWQRKRIRSELRRINGPTIVIAAVFGLIVFAPLGYALIDNIALLKTLIGLPEEFPAPLDFLKNIAAIPFQLFIKGPDNPAIWLGRIPILDMFSAAMFVLGLYAYYFRLKLDRTRFILALFIIGSVLVALNGPVTLTLLLPFVYIVIAAGVTLMLQQWFTVFPRNPLARTVGSSLLSIAILLACTFHVLHYFVAWPNTPATKDVYNQQLPR